MPLKEEGRDGLGLWKYGRRRGRETSEMKKKQKEEEGDSLELRWLGLGQNSGRWQRSRT